MWSSNVTCRHLTSETQRNHVWWIKISGGRDTDDGGELLMLIIQLWCHVARVEAHHCSPERNLTDHQSNKHDPQSHESTDAERRFTKVRASNRTPTRTTTMLLRKQHWYSLMNCIVDTLLFSFIGDMWHKMWVWDWWQNNTHETNMVKLQKSIVIRLLRT